MLLLLPYVLPACAQVGDRVAIASSSFFAEEVDEAVITAVTYQDGNTTTLLNLSAPLQYTHLGEVVSVPGESRTLDMRAEVAVLTRNVVITVGASEVAATPNSTRSGKCSTACNIGTMCVSIALVWWPKQAVVPS